MQSHIASEIRKQQGQIQQITFTQRLARNVALLSQTVTELRNDVLQEVTENPALEIKEDPNYESIETIQYEKYSGDDANKRFEFIESLLVSPKTLSEYLLQQLYLEIDDELERAIGERIIVNLNEYGFYTTPLQELCSDIEGANDEMLERIVRLIQKCDPVGCASANIMESLAVQIEYLEIPQQHKVMLNKCMALIAQDTKNASAKKELAHYLAHDDLKHYFHQITPYPGLAYNPHFTSQSEVYIIPDAVILISEEGSVEIRVNNDIIPIVDIKQDIQDITSSDDKSIVDFASQCIQAAQLFITGLEYRHYSLEKVVAFIAHKQLDFFTGKQEYLHPLTRKEIAAALDLNESTVSRIVTGKYIQTPCGIFEIKHFLSHSVGTTDASTDKIQKAIKKILQQFPQKRPNDERIAEMLAEQGISIARRTVAKYRKKLEECE